MHCTAGANDVANAFATSVGSRSLKLWQAVCIAVFTEFGGAVLLGASVTSTVKDSIINISNFSSRPDLLMSGFMSALMSSSAWVMFASIMGWPVSCTHSIIGALIGVGVSAGGFGTVNWGWDNKGVAQIVTSWFLSPILAGILASFIYLTTKHAVLKSKNSLRMGIWAIPFYFTITIFIFSFYVVIKNGKSTLSVKSVNGKVTVTGDIGLAFGIIAAITGATLIFCVGFLVPYFYRRLVKEEKLSVWHVPIIWFIKEQPKDPMLQLRLKQMFTPDSLTDDDRVALGMVAVPVADKIDSKLLEEGEAAVTEPATYSRQCSTGCSVRVFGREWDPEEEYNRPTSNMLLKAGRKIQLLLLRPFYLDLAAIRPENKAAVIAHEAATVYDNKTEYLYSLLQVVTACFASFAHGSNDVANAVGPLVGVYQIWQAGTFYKTPLSTPPSINLNVPVWMLAYGGAGISLGLALCEFNLFLSIPEHTRVNHRWLRPRISGTQSMHPLCLPVSTLIPSIACS